jgi:hypothetical protein
MRVPIMPEKAQPPTIIDPYAVLALSVALQRFQPLAPNRAKVRQTGRSVKPPKSLARLWLETAGSHATGHRKVSFGIELSESVLLSCDILSPHAWQLLKQEQTWKISFASNGQP